MSNQDPVVPFSLDDYFQSTPIGSIEKAIGNNLYGLNHRQIPGAVPIAKDLYGLTFFVRPQLNLQADNIRNDRLFYPLLSENETSLQRFVRCMLDPRLMEGYSHKGKVVIPALKCPLVDNQNAFISVLTNNLNSISGWPDIVVPTFTSKPGLYNEVYAQVDGIAKNFESFDIQATFKNTRGDPIIFMFYVWLHYQSLVHEGILVPYPDFITENEIDYNTRVYRLVLDPEKQFVRKISACGVGFPVSVPMGSFFDFNHEKPYNDQNSDITIQVKCLGAQYQDDRLILEFNQTVSTFNPGMRDKTRDKEMMKVSRSLLNMFNNRGYPRINPDNYELEWYVPRALFENRTALFLQANLADASMENEIGSGD